MGKYGEDYSLECRERKEPFVDTPKLYIRLTYSTVGHVVLDPAEEADWLAEAEEPFERREKIYLTDSEYEALPEFEG